MIISRLISEIYHEAPNLGAKYPGCILLLHNMSMHAFCQLINSKTYLTMSTPKK